MKIVISPAKSLDFEKCSLFKDSSKCIFLSDSEILIKKLKKVHIGKFEDWMHLSDHVPMTIELSGQYND